jgi:hypothetical protein
MAQPSFEMAAGLNLPPFEAAVGTYRLSNGGSWLFLPMFNRTIYFRKIEEN